MPGALGRTPTLSDGTVTLRAPVATDIEGSWEQCQDPLSQRWTTAPVPYTREDARTYLHHVVPGGWETDREWGFVVEAADDDGTARFAGTISLRNLGDRRAEVAYGAHPWARGRGLMERALRLLLEWGFEARDLQSVVWLSRRGNWASRRLAWRLGFVLEATLRDWLATRDGLVDAWVGTLRRGEPMAPRHPWPVAPRITGREVVLRATVEDDLPRILETFEDPLVQRYSRTTRERAPHSLDTVRARQLELAEEDALGSSVTWTAADPATDLLLGWVALYGLQPGGQPELGYWTHPKVRGRGTATAAARLAVRHAFIDAEDGGLGLHRLSASTAAQNLASRRVLEGAGFTRVGTERSSTLVAGGSFVDTCLYEQLVEDLFGTRSAV